MNGEDDSAPCLGNDILGWDISGFHSFLCNSLQKELPDVKFNHMGLLDHNFMEVKEAWYEKVFEILPKLHGEGFRDACHTISAMKEYPNVHAGRLKEALGRDDLDRNDRIALFHCIQELKGKEEVLDYFLEYLSTEENPTLLIYAVWCTEGVENRQLQELYVKLLDRYRSHENAKFYYKGSQMVLKGGACLGASRPEGQLSSNLMRQFDYFGLDYRGGWKLLMDEGRWREWKRQNGFV